MLLACVSRQPASPDQALIISLSTETHWLHQPAWPLLSSKCSHCPKRALRLGKDFSIDLLHDHILKTRLHQSDSETHLNDSVIKQNSVTHTMLTLSDDHHDCHLISDQVI